MSQLGIIVNPMSGRDVRRIAARASIMTHEHKLRQVTRLVLGAAAQGVDEILCIKDPFRISERAVENLPERGKVRLVDVPATHTAEDTRVAAREMWQAGCRTFIVLGGDGTNRIVASEFPDARLLPLSTGTNNVFPYMVEASVAGAAAGLIATDRVNAMETCLRTKRVHIEADGKSAIALVDAVVLQNDMLGSFLPFEAENIAALVLARAEPASIGMSPIGGFIEPCYHEDDFGVIIETGEPAVHRVSAPVSAGLYGDIAIRSLRRIALDERVHLGASGIVAFDGDRELKATTGVDARVSRDGPWIIEPPKVMADAVRLGAFSR